MNEMTQHDLKMIDQDSQGTVEMLVTDRRENEMEKVSEILEMMNDRKMNNNEVKNMNLENIENIENKKIMNASEMNVNAEYVFRTKVDDLVQIIGMDLEGNVLYTPIEYPMCVEEIMMVMEE